MSALAPYLNFAAAQVLVLGLGLGLGPLFPTTTVSVQNAVDPRDLGIATATLAFLRTFGSALGVAAFGAIIFAFGLVANEGGGPPAGASAPISRRSPPAPSAPPSPRWLWRRRSPSRSLR